MKAIRPVILVVAVGILLSLWTPVSAASQEEKSKQPAQPQEKVYIPKEIKTVLQEGLDAKQGRQDFTVNIFHGLYLPAQQNFQIIFFIKIKNSALGYAPPAVPPAEPKPAEKPETAPAQPADKLEAKFNVFVEFYRLNEGAERQVAKEIYVPATIQVDPASFDPEKEDVYSFGYPLPSGHYLLALAITTMDLQKIGTAYYEFTLPDASTFTKALETTPVFFLKSYEQTEGPETHTVFHKGFFTYSILKIVPNLDRIFAVGDNLDLFFYIIGAQPNEQKQYNIEIDFMVKKGEETAIRWTPQTYNSPLISQPLPLKQTVIIKSPDIKPAGEKTEQRDLPAGNYTLVITAQDKISGNSVTKTVDFEVK